VNQQTVTETDVEVEQKRRRRQLHKAPLMLPGLDEMSTTLTNAVSSYMYEAEAVFRGGNGAELQIA
jgi:hypothetical protein